MRCKTCGGPTENEVICRKCGERSLAATHLRSGRRAADTSFPRIPWLILIMANVVAGLLVLHPMQTTPEDYGPVFAVSAPAQSAPAPTEVAIPIIGLGSPAVAILQTTTAEPEASGAHSDSAATASGGSQTASSTTKASHEQKSKDDLRIKTAETPVESESGTIPRG